MRRGMGGEPVAKGLDQVERDAMQLSQRERALLAQHLLTTLDSGYDQNAEELWLREAESRYQQYRAGSLASKPAEQVFKDADIRST